MELKNYCVVVMGDTKNALLEIEKVSDSKPNLLDAKGIIIATFSAFITIKELKDWFTLNNRSFLVFDLSDESSAFKITKEDIHEGLFGFLKDNNQNFLTKRTSELEDMIEDAKIISETKHFNRDKFIDKFREDFKEENYLNESVIDKMYNNEKQLWIGKILDKGIENLTEKDKKMLTFLVK